MNRHVKPVSQARIPGPEAGSAAGTGSAAAPEPWTPEVAEALADIATESGELLRIYAERLKTDDGYRVIDQRTVTSTFQELFQKAAADPAAIIQHQFALWTDLASLWQRTAS